MRKLLLNSLMSLAVATTAMSFAPMASAQNLELEFGRQGPTMRLVEPCDPVYENCGYSRRDRDYDYRYSGRNEVRYARCTEDRALDKAERMGLRRVRIESAGRRVIEVRGRQRDGDRVIVAFGRAPSCPIL
jgi:hypothetical protein